MSFLDMILPGLKFNRKELGEVGKNEKNTIPAIIMIGIYVTLISILAIFYGNSGPSGFSGDGLTGFTAFLAELGSGLIGSFLNAVIITCILRIFKDKSSPMGLIRVYGAVIIWSIIGQVINLLIPFMFVFIVFFLVFNVALLIGVIGYTEKKWWQVFIAIVLAFLLVFVLTLGFSYVFMLFVP